MAYKDLQLQVRLCTTSIVNKGRTSADNQFLYGPRVHGKEVMSMYGNSHAQGFGPEVQIVIQQDFKSALQEVDLHISPVAPTAAYKIGEKVNDSLAMYVGDLMTSKINSAQIEKVNVNLAGLPTLVVLYGLVKGGTYGLPIGLQMIGLAFGEESLLRLGHIFEQTLPMSFSASILVVAGMQSRVALFV